MSLFMTLFLGTSIISTITTVLSYHYMKSTKANIVEGLEAGDSIGSYLGPEVSVIIPTLNEEDFLPGLIKSIRAQSYRPIEIVVADSSSDSTPDIARAAGATVTRVEELNIARARNEGARVARGEVLLFCDSDCVMSSDYVERMVRVLDGGARLAHGVEVNMDGSLVRNAFAGPWAAVKPVWWTTGRGVAVRAADFWAVGGYDEDCFPTEGCREDLRFGRKISDRFGDGALQLDRGARLATYIRRGWEPGGIVWEENQSRRDNARIARQC